MPEITPQSESLVILFTLGMLFVAVIVSLAFGEFDADNW